MEIIAIVVLTIVLFDLYSEVTRLSNEVDNIKDELLDIKLSNSRSDADDI